MTALAGRLLPLLLLQLLAIALKGCGAITWTWTTVLAPLWLAPALILSALVVCAFVVCLPLAFVWLESRFPIGGP